MFISLPFNPVYIILFVSTTKITTKHVLTFIHRMIKSRLYLEPGNPLLSLGKYYPITKILSLSYSVLWCECTYLSCWVVRSGSGELLGCGRDIRLNYKTEQGSIFLILLLLIIMWNLCSRRD